MRCSPRAPTFSLWLHRSGGGPPTTPKRVRCGAKRRRPWPKRTRPARSGGAGAVWGSWPGQDGFPGDPGKRKHIQACRAFPGSPRSPGRQRRTQVARQAEEDPGRPAGRRAELAAGAPDSPARPAADPAGALRAANTRRPRAPSLATCLPLASGPTGPPGAPSRTTLRAPFQPRQRSAPRACGQGCGSSGDASAYPCGPSVRALWTVPGRADTPVAGPAATSSTGCGRKIVGPLGPASGPCAPNSGVDRARPHPTCGGWTPDAEAP